jgi:hypothetical protein
MLDFSEDDLRSKHCIESSPPDDAEKDWALFQQLYGRTSDYKPNSLNLSMERDGARMMRGHLQSQVA